MKSNQIFIVLSILLLLAKLNSAQTFHYIQVQNNYFSPADLTIQVGDTVRWINGIDGGGIHNVIADDSSFTSGPPAFPWIYDHVFTSEGIFPYYCSVHGGPGGVGMSGVITVESPTNVKDNVLSPDIFELNQNYPNPFNPSTTITWQSSVASHQTLKVFDVLGNEVTTLVDEYKPAGTYEIEFNAANLSSGIYFYRISIQLDKLYSGTFIANKKMILIK